VLRVRLEKLIFGVIHKKVGPLQMRIAEFKTKNSMEQRAERIAKAGGQAYKYAFTIRREVWGQS